MEFDLRGQSSCAIIFILHDVVNLQVVLLVKS